MDAEPCTTKRIREPSTSPETTHPEEKKSKRKVPPISYEETIDNVIEESDEDTTLTPSYSLTLSQPTLTSTQSEAQRLSDTNDSSIQEVEASSDDMVTATSKKSSEQNVDEKLKNIITNIKDGSNCQMIKKNN